MLCLAANRSTSNGPHFISRAWKISWFNILILRLLQHSSALGYALRAQLSSSLGTTPKAPLADLTESEIVYLPCGLCRRWQLCCRSEVGYVVLNNVRQRSAMLGKLLCVPESWCVLLFPVLPMDLWYGSCGMSLPSLFWRHPRLSLGLLLVQVWGNHCSEVHHVSTSANLSVPLHWDG